MDLATQRLSEAELTARILEMAQTGVYRESIFEAFQPLATKRQIRSAIAQAKQFGLHSVASLRDPELGTYYQVNGANYRSFQVLMKESLPLEQSDNLAQHLVETARIVRTMLAIAGLAGTGLFAIGGWLLLQGQAQSGGKAWLGAACAGSIWLVQRAVAKRVL